MEFMLPYLVIGGVLSYILIYSGKYKMRSLHGDKIDELWKAKKAILIALTWPYVVFKGLIQSNR